MSKIRVLVIDDAAVMRRLIASLVNEDSDCELAGLAANGLIALEMLALRLPDIVTLDIEMPGLDGLATLDRIHALYPGLPVIMCSSLTQRGTRHTVEALTRGAVGYINKPSERNHFEDSQARLRQDLLPLLKVHGRNHRPPLPPARSAPPPEAPRVAPAAQPCSLVAIGASTGGPHALSQVLSALPSNFPVPVVVVQHMPAMFTALLADRLQQTGQLPVCEVAQGEPIVGSRVYLAPGGRHFELVLRGSQLQAHLHDSPPENSCRPAVDVLFRSAGAIAGAGTLAVVLTGMGQDGLQGAAAIHRAGGTLLIQDQASSVVWGMPGAIARSGLPHTAFPLADIAAVIRDRVRRSS